MVSHDYSPARPDLLMFQFQLFYPQAFSALQNITITDMTSMTSTHVINPGISPLLSANTAHICNQMLKKTDG